MRTRLDLEPTKGGGCSPCSYRRTIKSVPYYPTPASCVSHSPCTVPLQRRPRRVWIGTRPALLLDPEPMKSGSCSPCSYRRTTEPLPYYPIPASCLSYNPCAEGRPRGLCTCTTTTSTKRTRLHRICFNGPEQYSWAYFCIEFSKIIVTRYAQVIHASNLRPKNMLKCVARTKIVGLNRGVYIRTWIKKISKKI